MKNLKSIFFTIVLFMLFLSFNSCNVLKVSNTDTNGIPFYIQKQIVKQKTKYLYDWQEISFIKEEKKENKIVETVLFTLRIKKDQDLKKVYVALDKLNSLPNASKAAVGVKIQVADVIDEIKKLTKVTLTSNDITTSNLIENSAKKTVVVDYTKPYYLNAKMPWFGNATLSQKINTNGTLAESSSTIDSQLDELAAAAAAIATPISQFRIAELPFKFETEEEVEEMIEKNNSFFKNGKSALFLKALKENLQTNYTYKIKLSEKGYVYTFSRDIEIVDAYKADTPIAFNLKTGNYTRENWPTIVKKAKKEDKKTIDVSAQIGLPKKD